MIESLKFLSPSDLPVEMMGWRCLAVHIAVAAATVADFAYGDDMETERTREPKSVLWFSASYSLKNRE